MVWTLRRVEVLRIVSIAGVLPRDTRNESDVTDLWILKTEGGSCLAAATSCT